MTQSCLNGRTGEASVQPTADTHRGPDRDLFLKAGAGRSIYSNHHPSESGSSGWGATIGAGYDWPIGGKLALTPVINHSQGGLGRVEDQSGTSQSWEYCVFEFGIALTYR